VFDRNLVLRPAHCGAKCHGEKRLQGVPRRRRLTTWVVNNREKSKHLGKHSGLGYGAIL